MKTYYLDIAGLFVRVSFVHLGDMKFDYPPMHYLPFKLRGKVSTGSEVLLDFNIDQDLEISEHENWELIGWFDDDDVDTPKRGVFRASDGSYVFFFENHIGKRLFVMQSSADFKHNTVRFGEGTTLQCIGFKYALMLAYAFASAPYGCLLIHSSAVLLGGKAYLFLGKSGTGKSSHTSLWLKNFDEARLLNDDSPVIRVDAGKAIVYGSPWSGHTPCYRQESAPIAAVAIIEHSSSNTIEPLSPAKALSTLLSSCSAMMWDKRIYDDILRSMSMLIELVGIHRLACLPTDSAALLSFNTFTRCKQSS